MSTILTSVDFDLQSALKLDLIFGELTGQQLAEGNHVYMCIVSASVVR